MNHPASSMALEADRLRFSYPNGVEAITDLTLRVSEGEFVAVMGTNGSGKTTLMRVLLRLLTPQSGHVRLAGIDIGDLRPAELYRRIGLVFQNPADQLFGTSVEQDVAFGPRNLGLSAAEVTARVEQSLAAVDALELRHRGIHQLSYGQQKRVCLAGVLAMQPKILLLDEPTGGLDPAAESQMVDLLLRLNRKQKITIILSTHAVDLLPVLADRVYILQQGSVSQQGTPREVFADPQAIVQAGLRLPMIAQVFHELGRQDGMSSPSLPLTIDEGRRRILEWIATSHAAPRQGVLK